MGRIKLRSQKYSEYNTALRVQEREYHIQTEMGTEKNPFITTTAYQQGSVVEVIKQPCPARNGRVDPSLTALMKRQHADMVDLLTAKHEPKAQGARASRKQYIDHLKKLISGKQMKEALGIIEEACRTYPRDPYLLSYHGYLRASIAKDHGNGMKMCKDALEMLKEQMPVGAEFFFPVFLLNIGRVYLLSGRTQHAINNFRRGLELDPGNVDLIGELQRLGLRRSPVIPFLSRNNLLNKYLGKAMTRMNVR
ncbi:MAG: tetratricopeptide repeat protein [Thermodesulfovibrionales bacterium]